LQIAPDGFSAITTHSLLAFVGAILWAVLAFAAMAGYGAALLRAFGLRRTPPTLSSLAGIPATVFLGGLLNAASLITVHVLIAFVILGVLAAAALIRPEVPTTAPIPFAQKSVTAKVLLLLAIAVFAYRAAGSVHDCQMQISDDFNYYLAAPLKTLELHSFRGDVFSERRVMSSIGGNEFLGALILTTQPVESAAMADWMFGLFLLGLLAFNLGKLFDLTEAQRYALALLLLITPQLRFNLTFVLLPSAIFAGLVYVAAYRSDDPRWETAQLLLLGALTGAVSSMKSSYVVHGALFLFFLGLLRWRTRNLAACMRLLALSAVAGVLVMLPWMLSNISTAGTAFYPLLGKGFQYAAYGHYPPPTNPDFHIFFRKVVPFCVPMMLLLAAELIWGEREERPRTLAVLLLTALIGSLFNGLVTGGDSVRRYNYPCILPAITLATIVFARRRNLAPTLAKYRTLYIAVAAFALLVAINTGTTTFTSEYKNSWRLLKASLTDYRATPASTRAEYKQLEAALPPGSTALTTVQNTFLLDFTRNNYLIADWAGAASPKPGWPLWEDSEALAQFLLAHHVRYIIYGYEDCHLASNETSCQLVLDKDQLKRRTDFTITQWIREEAAVGYDARKQYMALSRTRRHIYDDGKIFILDLTQPTH